MLLDSLDRPARDLRISVTDRCNFRCTYCMPFETYEWIEKGEILSFEEIARLARIFIPLGVEKIRLNFPTCRSLPKTSITKSRPAC